ncbi:MAG: hypothetical protein LBL26_11570 [Peptococcaceae bacterium]|jgi:hypothetical protein|nr:hypothetical protein [Peptococcaceae bacterium]
MEITKESNDHSLNGEAESLGTKLRLTVNDCAVTLNFPPETESSVLPEIKRMMLSGQSNGQSNIQR